MIPKTYYSASELACLRLQSLPHTKANVINKAKRDSWQFRPRSGKGGGFEYALSSLPLEVQQEIKERETKALMTTAPTVERELVIAERDINQLTDKQRAAADARLRMVGYVKQLEQAMLRKEALEIVSLQSQAGELPDDLNEVCAVAVAKQRKRCGVGKRVLHQWCIDADKCETPAERLNALAPIGFGKPEMPVTRIEWMPEFLAVYRRKNGICIAEAYREFAKIWRVKHGKDVPCPSVDAVHRAMDKLPRWVRECGRLTGASARALKTYVKRDWSNMMPNDVWMGDGHSMKMKVQHPVHGQPFTPELTLIMDTCSRFVVGWSLSYSENQIAVGDALRDAVTKHGIPAIYYSDNGGGQKNKTFDTDTTGIFARLGTRHETGIPGNPQGRGMIERLNKTLAHYIARQFETYYGPGADPDTVREALTGTASLQKAIHEGKTELTPKQQRALGKLPRWEDLLDVIEQAVKQYNFEHKHSSIGNVTPAAMREYLLEQMDEADMVLVTEVEARDLFRPQFTRKVQRGYIQLFNNYYWHRELENYDAKEVVVAVDQHDASSVIVRTADGKWICDAILNGNTIDGFPLSLVEHQKKERTKRAVKRLEDKANKAKAELNPVLEAAVPSAFDELLRPAPKQKTKKYAVLKSELEQERNKNEK